MTLALLGIKFCGLQNHSIEFVAILQNKMLAKIYSKIHEIRIIWL